MSALFAWADVERITQGQLSRNFHSVCPFCSHTRPVFAVKLKEPDFAIYNCAHCGESGYVRPDTSRVQRIAEKLPIADVEELIVVVNPTTHGRYGARLLGHDQVLCVSTTPFFSAARKLIAAGYAPEMAVVMRRARSETDCLKSLLGIAASMTVEETKYGPKFRSWVALPAPEGTPRIALRHSTGGQCASVSGRPVRNRQRLRHRLRGISGTEN